MTFNAGQSFGFPGGERQPSGQFGSLLNNLDFSLLHINVIAATANPIAAVPAKLANNVYWTNAGVEKLKAIGFIRSEFFQEA
jgi:bilirubin oxidase